MGANPSVPGDSAELRRNQRNDRPMRPCTAALIGLRRLGSATAADDAAVETMNAQCSTEPPMLFGSSFFWPTEPLASLLAVTEPLLSWRLPTLPAAG